MDNDIFYSYNKILSYNALINILVGEAGVGKTFGATKFVINRFKKFDEEFAYIRRYKKEVDYAVPKFFNAMKDKNVFPNDILKNIGRTFLCNDRPCGYAMELSTAQDLKGSEFSKVKNILFDEFIIEKGQKKYYLKNEVNTFLRLIETLGRLRDIRVFMLGNATDITNPYFLYFNLSLPYNNDIALFKNNTILLQYMKNEKYREVKRKTRFGQLIEGTDYFFNSNNVFIGKKQGSSKFSFAFIYNGNTFGVWFDYSLRSCFCFK